MIHSKKLDAEGIYQHKRMKTKVHQSASSYNQDRYEKFLHENNQKKMGVLAGCFVWMLETKNMNRSYEVANSVAGSSQYNRSTLLCRRKPVVKSVPVPVSTTTTSDDEISTSNDDAEEEEEEIPDNWEDLDI